MRRYFCSVLASLFFSALATSVQAAPQNAVSYHFADIDNVKVFYREAGDPKKPLMVLLHGFPSSSHMFRDLIPLLAPSFHVVAPDYPGMGYSEAPAESTFPATFDNVTKVVGDLIKQIGSSNVILYMQDFGGPVGMRLATSNPDIVSALIFQNTPVSEDGWTAAGLKRVQSTKGLTPQQVVGAKGFLSEDSIVGVYTAGAENAGGLNPDAWTSDAHIAENPDRKRIMASLYLDISSNLALYPSWQKYLSTKQPKTLIVWGKNDPVFSVAGAEKIHSLVKDSKLVYYDAGHYALEEHSAPIADQITGFFAKH